MAEDWRELWRPTTRGGHKVELVERLADGRLAVTVMGHYLYLVEPDGSALEPTWSLVPVADGPARTEVKT